MKIKSTIHILKNRKQNGKATSGFVSLGSSQETPDDYFR